MALSLEEVWIPEAVAVMSGDGGGGGSLDPRQEKELQCCAGHHNPPVLVVEMGQNGLAAKGFQ